MKNEENYYDIYDLIHDVNYDIKSRNYLTYSELMSNIFNKRLDTKKYEFKVLNSDDTRLYEFRDGSMRNIDKNDFITFEQRYAGCDLSRIRLEILAKKEPIKKPKRTIFDLPEEDRPSTERLFTKIPDDVPSNRKYYNEDDFLNKCDTPMTEARKTVLKEIEDLYMDLSMEIDNCQGCMDGLDQAFEELRIYKDLIRYLGGNIDKNHKEVLDRWYEKAKKREKEENNVKERTKILMNKLDEIHNFIHNSY